MSIASASAEATGGRFWPLPNAHTLFQVVGASILSWQAARTKKTSAVTIQSNGLLQTQRVALRFGANSTILCRLLFICSCTSATPQCRLLLHRPLTPSSPR